MLPLLVKVQLNVAGLIAIIGAVVVAGVFFIALPIIFFQNKPRRGVMSLTINASGLLELSNELETYFESIQVLNDKVIFTRKPGVNIVNIELVTFKEDGSKYGSLYQLRFEDQDVLEIMTDNRESKLVGANVVVKACDGNKIKGDSLVGQKFIYKLLLAIGQGAGCVFVGVFTGISISYFFPYNSRYAIVYILAIFSALSGLAYILFDKLFSRKAVGGNR